MLICDALKGHYRRTQAPVYIELYAQIRKEAIDELQRMEDATASAATKAANAR
jgi:hypothetical protein